MDSPAPAWSFKTGGSSTNYASLLDEADSHLHDLSLSSSGTALDNSITADDTIILNPSPSSSPPASRLENPSTATTFEYTGSMRSLKETKPTETPARTVSDQYKDQPSTAAKGKWKASDDSDRATQLRAERDRLKRMNAIIESVLVNMQTTNSNLEVSYLIAACVLY